MLKRIRVVTLLTAILILFTLLQFSSSGLFFQTIRSDKQNFIFNQHIRELQTSLGTAWMAMVQARTLLNQAGMIELHSIDQHQSQAEFIAMIETKLQLAKNAMAQFNQNLQPDEVQSDFTLQLNAHYQNYFGTLTSLLSDIDHSDMTSFMNKPVQKSQDQF